MNRNRTFLYTQLLYYNEINYTCIVTICNVWYNVCKLCAHCESYMCVHCYIMIMCRYMNYTNKNVFI